MKKTTIGFNYDTQRRSLLWFNTFNNLFSSATLLLFPIDSSVVQSSQPNNLLDTTRTYLCYNFEQQRNSINPITNTEKNEPYLL